MCMCIVEGSAVCMYEIMHMCTVYGVSALKDIAAQRFHVTMWVWCTELL